MKRLLFVMAFMAVLPALWNQARANTGSAYEKVFVLTDNEVYQPGDTIVFKGYVADPSETPVSRYLYVELLNQSLDRNGAVKKNFMPKVIDWAKVVEVNDAYNGILVIPGSTPSGTYIIRAYTRAQKDAPGQLLFHKSIVIDSNAKAQASSNGEVPVSVKLSQAKKIWEQMDKSGFVPGPREMMQKVHFTIQTSKKKLPKRYDIGIASDELGLYLSYQVEDGKILNPDAYANAYLELENEGNTSASSSSFALSVPDFYDGVSFVVNVTGSFFIYPAAQEAEYAAYFDYSSTGDGSLLSAVKNYSRYNDSRVKDAEDADIQADTLKTLVVAADSKPGFISTKGNVGPYTSTVEARNVRTRDEMKKNDDMDLLTYIVSSYPGLYLKAGEDGRFITSNRMVLKMVKSAGESGEPVYEVGNPIPPIYIDGMLSDWTEASHLKVFDVENVFVLKNADAALYRTDLVVLLQLRGAINGFSRGNRSHNNTIVLKPMGVKNVLLLEEN